MKKITVSIIAAILICTISGTAPASLNDGLVAYYPFNGNANDESGNGNHLSINGANIGSDRFGNEDSAYDFDGLDDYMSITGSQMSITNSLTISVWFKNTDELFSDAYGNYIISKGATSSAPWTDFAIYLESMQRQIRFSITNETGAQFSVYTNPIDDNLFYHIVGVYDYVYSKLKVYLNGELQEAIDATGIMRAANDNFYIGDWNGTSGWHFSQGTIDDLHIYNRPLSGAEIVELYRVGTDHITATIDHGKIDEDLTDFPVLIHLSESSGVHSFDASDLFSKLSSYEDRKKISVRTSDGKQCYTEIERFDAENTEAWLWVKVPLVSAAEDTKLKIYYDKNMPDQNLRSPSEAGDTFSIEDASPPASEKWQILDGAPDIQDGKLRLHAHGSQETIVSSWFISGDFDIQYDFNILQAPSLNRWLLTLKAVTAENKIIQVNREYENGNYYKIWSFENDWLTVGQAAAGDNSGKIRLARVGDIFYAYYWNNGWIDIANTSVQGIRHTDDLQIQIYLRSMSDNPDLTAEVDNFHVISADAITGFVGDTGEFPAQQVWDQNFVGVLHMTQNASCSGDCVKDSTSYSNNAIPGSGMSDSDLTNTYGKIAKAIDFDGGINDYLRVLDSESLSFGTSDFTVSACINSNYTGYQIIASTNFGSPNKYFNFSISTDHKGVFSIRGGGDSFNANTTSELNNGTWHTLAGVRKGDDAYVYVDSTLEGVKAGVDNLDVNHTFDMVIGRDEEASGRYYFNGLIDEFRLSKIARSSSWVKASHYSNYDDLIAYSTSGDLIPPAEVNTLIVDSAGDGTTVALNWTGYDEDGAGDVAYYRIYVESSDFTTVPANELATVSAGQFSYTATGLVKGETYFFVIIAVDHAGNAITEVTSSPASGIPTDIEPPGPVTNLQVDCTETALTVAWDHSANSAGDLANYKVYFDGDSTGVPVDSTRNFYEVTGLNPAAGYEFAVTAIDNDGNESAPASTTGVTLLENPVNLIAASSYGRVDLNWSSVTSPELVKYYAVYMSQSPFTSVAGMTPETTAIGTLASISGLSSDVTYFFAVTAVNLSDGERKDVTAVSADSLPVTYISGIITANTTWTLAGSPYIVSGDVTVRYPNRTYGEGFTTLTIEPGVEVRFEAGAGLYIGQDYSGTLAYYGALSARGTAAAPIIFTSNAATPAPGDWKGIYFRDPSKDASTILEHCVVEYGGHTHNANLYFSGASPTITDSTIRYSSGHGIYSNDGSSGYITDNVFSGNGTSAVSVRPGYVNGRINGNSIAGRGENNILIRAGALTSSDTWSKNEQPYVVSGDVTVRYPNRTYGEGFTTLTIEPGVEVRFEAGAGLYIGQEYSGTLAYYGALSARGTPGAPIIFTSNAATPAPGDWKGIYFRDPTKDAATILEHCVVEYGGHTHAANLYFAAASPTIRVNTLRYSSGHGINLNGSFADIANNNVANNSLHGIFGNDNSNAVITDNTLVANDGSAINIHPNSAKNTSGNSCSGNGKDFIELREGAVTSSGSWSKNGQPYVVSGDVTVRYPNRTYGEGFTTLTIEPGVEVRFERGTGLYIGQEYSGTLAYYGALSARGTPEAPIIFTSNAATPAPGDWKGIYFRDPTKDAATTLEHCVVEYGGHTHNANLYFLNANPAIMNSNIRYSSVNGIYLNSASPVVKNSFIGENSESGLYLTGSSSPTIGGEAEGNIISSNGTYGIYSSDAVPFPIIIENAISNNSSYPIRVGAMMNVKDNICSGNGIQAIEIFPEIINADTLWRNNGIQYVITGDVTVRYPNRTYGEGFTTLTIEPGVEVRFEAGAGLYIGQDYSGTLAYYGALFARGTAAAPIIFTSNAATPAPGDWKGIYFRDPTKDASTILEHCVVEYGGHTHAGNLYFAGSSPTITENTIRYSSGHGIYSNDGSSGYITDNVFSGNGTSAVSVRPGDVNGRINGNSIAGRGENNIQIRAGALTSSDTWSKNEQPYVVSGDVTVRYPNRTFGEGFTTLTIEPGVEVRFEAGAGLYIGQDYSLTLAYYGALSARGTPEAPIIFTSNATTPAPGDWKGIYFRDPTKDAATILEHCVVEYGGHTHAGNLYFAGSSPTITDSTIRYSSGHGIYSNDGSSGYITDNVFSGNGTSAVSVHPGDVNGRINGNSIAGRGENNIQIRAGALTSSDTWSKNEQPYVVSGDVTVRYPNRTFGEGFTALTIEPGVEVRFEAEAGLYIGQEYSGTLAYYGALSAQGTPEAPIIFTSNAATPAPGDWKGIFFRDPIIDAATILEHSVVEYGGHTHNANLHLSNAKPTIQYNNIRNSSHSGVYVNGTGSNGAIISCNNLKDNLYGVYTTGSAQPLVNHNNFLRSQQYGAYNAGSAALDVRNNWWGDANGPGFNGDELYGNIEFTPWLTAESDCIGTPPTNTAPFVPKNPVPANGAVRVPVTAESLPIPVTLKWAGSDPNPWDTVTYDIYFGTAEDNLVIVAEGIESASYDKASLEEGTTYYWKIVARDDVGAETAGPVWQFTTLGSPPDLILSDIVWQPAADLQAGQSITFTASVENTGSGPVVDAFQVTFYIDGNSIGSKTVNPVMHENTSLPLSYTWTAATGNHIIEMRADSQNKVIELYEENNSRSVDLPYVKDPTAPDLVGTIPANGASVKKAIAIEFILNDQYGLVDDAAVIASVVVLNGGGQSVGGAVSEASDRFTFTPNTVPLADDTYSVSLTARDLEGNTKEFTFSFTVDGQPPAEPAITGGVVLSGLIQVRPVLNRSKTATIILTGNREDNTAVYINNQKKINFGSGNWSAELNLAQGDNALEIRLLDAAGNPSPSVWVDIQADSVAPAISGITPAPNSFVNVAPSAVVVTFAETTSGLNLDQSTLSIRDGSQQAVDGAWAVSGPDQLIFTPTSAFADSYYTISLILEDEFGNRSAAKTYHFTLDTTPPEAPVVSPVSSPTHKPSQEISGTREAYAALLLNGSQIVGHTALTTWTYTANLSAGDNSFAFVARDQAGNQSEAVTVAIFFDDVPPPAVDTLRLNTEGDGRTIELDWTGYNEAIHGDVTGYRIYRSTATFTDVSAANLIGTAGAGIYKFTAADLTRATTYWFAVVAVDAQGNARTAVSPVSGTAKDIVPPENVSNLIAQSFADHLVFTWTHSAGSHGDLAGYRVVFEADGTNEVISAGQNSFEKTGLAAASGYLLKVSAVDNDANESSGLTVTGVTLLANPGNLTAEVHSGYVDLSWSGFLPSQYVKHYAIYASESDFSSVAGMTPTLTSNQIEANTSNQFVAKVAGLTNNKTYYFAVTTVNTSDGELQTVATITAKPEPDSLGPEISSVKIDDQPLADGGTLTKPGTFSCDAQDPAGVSRVEFFINGSLVRTDYNPIYTGFWNVVEVQDGAYTLTIDAYDTLGNLTTESYSLNVTLATPVAPQITEPAAGTITNKPTVTVSGQAEKFTAVSLYINGSETGVVVAVDASGTFSTPLTLAEGENHLQAAAGNRAGLGPKSAEVRVTLDTTLPASPSNFAAEARTAGAVRLTWKAPADTEVAGYNLYRASSSFVTLPGAGKINTDLLQATSFDDLPPSDGTWYYRVSTVDAAANESDLSAEAVAQADSTAPRASAIDYSPQGTFDALTGTMAPGTVNVVLTVNEPLQAAPYLSIAPDGGIPIAVQLSKDSDTTYSGFFVISDSTPSGTAYAIFSARDSVGNRGTEIDTGSVIQIDSNGPSATRLVVSPPAPINNDEQNPVTVTVVLGLDEKIKSTDFPQLSYLLSGDQRDPIEIDSLTEIDPQAGDVQTWQAQFELPTDAGLNGAETFYFIYQGTDALDNVSDRILAENRFQVYQGELPPLAAPLELKANSLPGGKIRLTWLAVEQAVGYQLYRKAPGESELTAYARLDVVEAFEDTPAEDGSYTYAIASIRQENSQEALSGLSDPVVVNSDAVAPGPPHNLALELVTNGVKVIWEPPPYTEEVTYSLYRSDIEITTTEGLTALATGIAQTMVVDPTPSLSDHWYAVTAVDAVGNESPPSNADYLNVQLLPVSGITVVQADNEPPEVTWTHPGGDIAGYDIYLGADNAPVKLNPTLLTDKAYTDSGYSRDERRYTIVTVDSSEVESLGRSLTLPVLQAVLSDGSRIKRGIMNRLDYVVLNEGAGRVENIRLKVKVGSYDHTSEPFNLDPGTSRTIPVVVGGYDDLEGIAALATTIEVTPRINETVQIIRSGQIEVTDGMLGLQILNEEFTRAASGKVQFTIENTGEAEIEIVTAKNSGNSASDQITFYLLDEDENVLSTRPFKQATGNKIVSLSNKNTVARIPAGETFTSDLISMPVPANAPDHVIIRLDIDPVYYHQGQATQVEMDGLSTTHAVTLVDTAYFGELLDITPQSSTGDQDVVITGQAVERASNDPMASVPLTLVITLDGFERSYDVFTGDDGVFTHSFKALPGESGIYRVRAVHPDLTDKPVHGEFVINKVSITPATLNLNAPKNYTNTIQIRVQTGDGTTVNNLRLEYAAEDQPTGEKPPGVHLTPGQPIVELGGKQAALLPFTIWADNTAGATEIMNLTLKSGETDPVNWGKVTINARFSEARPSLYFTPNHVETGVSLNDTVSEIVNLQNKGLADLYDVQLSLLDASKNVAPSWIYLNSAVNQGNLAIGETREVGFAVSPTAAIAEGDYAFYLRVEAANHPTTDIHLYVAVPLEGQGNALFKISDIYTGTLDDNADVIQGLAGAKVKLQNEAVLTEEYVKTTDSYGEAWFEDLQAGRYKCRITANNHQEYIGRVWIKPGVATTEDVFLDYNLVTVEWSVTEITIEDKYDIVLTAVYETDVPAAVVVIEPASVALPQMRAGDVFNGEFILTNYGLIRADNLNFSLPPDDQNFKYEILGGLPDSLEAKQRITVAYRVTCLKSLDNEDDGTATGGGCYSYRKCAQATYQYDCASDVTTDGSTTYCWTSSYGSCGGGGISTGGGGGTWSVGGGSGSGTVSKPAPQPKTIEGVECFPKPTRKERFCLPCWFKDTFGNTSQNTDSSVNLVMREYYRDHVDLSVKVPGGTIEAKRWFYDNQWLWEHDRNKLTLKKSSLASGIESIDKGGVIYEKSSIDADIFIHDIFRIVKTDTGFRWEDPKGGWIDYDQSGNVTSYGSRTGVQAKLLYQDGKLTGVADRDNTPVLWYETDDDGLITAVSGVDNRRVEYSYTDGRLSKVKDVLGYETSYEYDNQGRLEKIIEPAGRIITVSYDKYNGVAAVVDSQGEGFFFEYEFDEATREQYARIESSAGKIKEVWYDRDFETRRVDINGRTVQKIAKDGRNLLVTDEQGNVTRKDYDEWDNLTKVVYPDGSAVSYEYEHKYNKRVEETDENEVVTRYAYDDSGNLIKKTEAAGTENERITEYTYDDDGDLLTTLRRADANTVEALTQLSYDLQGNLTSITDPEGGITRFTSHDAMGNVLIKTDARDKQWKYEYDAAGQLKKIIDPLDNATELFYDEMGKKIKEVDAGGNEKAYAYDERNNLTKVADALGNITQFEYNPDGKLIKQIDPEGKTIHYEYDLDGRLLKTIDGNGNQIAMEYADATGSGCSSCSAAGGASNQPTRITYPTFSKEFAYDKRGRKTIEKDILTATESYLTDFDYDPAGNLIGRTDKEDRRTGYAYDTLNRLKIVTDPLNQETEYFYDNRDNLTALTDAKTNTTWFEYDRNNRLVKEIRPEGQVTAYQYDNAGNLTGKVDAKNQKTEYDYDDVGRLAEIRYFETTDHVNAAKTVTFSYDQAGNLTGYNDGITSAIYTYDDLYRKLSETVKYGPFLELTNSYSYYDNGLKKTFTGPEGVTYAYTYDDNNQLTGVNIPGAGYITYSSYRWNRPTDVILPGGSKREYDYDPLMRVKSIAVKDPAQNILLNYQYNYDKMDNIGDKATEHGQYDYDYDELYRLTASDNPVQADEGFSYDAVGNRLTAEGVADDWSYNDNNELQGYDGITFEYDDNGNMTKKTDVGQVTSYIYNVEDRLTEIWNGAVGTGSLISNYYYDPFGRRLWKEVNGVRTYFVYADEGLVAEVDEAGNVTKSYGYKPGSTWTTDPLFMKVGGQYYFYQNDHLGTPQKLTAVNGAVVWSAKYSSFGEAIVDVSSTVTNNLRFPGQYYDQETGLHYNYHRYYDPKTGRYLTLDPMGLSGGAHLYSYVSNMPVRFVDVRGLYCKRSTPWKQATVIESDTNKANLLTRIKKGKWRKIQEVPTFPLPGRGMPRGGAVSKIVGYTCQWEKIGCQQISTYSKSVLFEARFECGIGECPKKEWTEQRRKYFSINFDITEDYLCLFRSQVKVTHGLIRGECSEPSGP